MAFKLAEAFVQFSSRGVSGVIGTSKRAAAAIGAVDVAAAGARRILDGLVLSVQLAAQAEQTAVAFEVLTGSVDKSTRLIGELQDLAAETPFDTVAINEAARKLLAFNTSAEETPETLRRIGDVAAGIQAPIGEIAEIYGKARVQGRLFMEDVNQLTGRGIPIIQELARQFGVADSEVRSLVEDGRVTFTNLEEAFRRLTSEGGQFAGMMARQSETATGLFSTLQDNVRLALTDIGEGILEGLDVKDLERSLIEFSDTFTQEFVPPIVAGIGLIGDGLREVDDLLRALEIIAIVAATDLTGIEAAQIVDFKESVDELERDLERVRSDFRSRLKEVLAEEPPAGSALPQASPFTDADRAEAERIVEAGGRPLLGDRLADLEAVAAGSKQPLAEIAAMYAAVRERGHVTVEDLIAFAERGIPVWDALADRMGTSKAVVEDMARAGRIGGFEFEAAFGDLTQAGGEFAGVLAAHRSFEEQRRIDAEREREKGRTQTEELIAREKEAAADLRAEREREAERIIEATRTPAERLAAELDRLESLRDEGLLDAETFARAVAQAREDLTEDQRRSREAVSGRFRFDELANQAQGAALDFAEKQLAVQEEQLAVQQALLAAQQGAGPQGPAVAEEPPAVAEQPPAVAEQPPARDRVGRDSFWESISTPAGMAELLAPKPAGEKIEDLFTYWDDIERLLVGGIERTAEDREEIRLAEEQARQAARAAAAVEETRDALVRDGVKIKGGVPAVAG